MAPTIVNRGDKTRSITSTMDNFNTENSNNVTVRRRGLSSPTNETEAANISSNSIPRKLTSKRFTESPASSERAEPNGALYGASNRGLLENEVRRDFILGTGQGPNFGKTIGDSYLTLMDEVVLLGLKDQQVIWGLFCSCCNFLGLFVVYE